MQNHREQSHRARSLSAESLPPSPQMEPLANKPATAAQSSKVLPLLQVHAMVVANAATGHRAAAMGVRVTKVVPAKEAAPDKRADLELTEDQRLRAAERRRDRVSRDRVTRVGQLSIHVAHPMKDAPRGMIRLSMSSCWRRSILPLTRSSTRAETRRPARLRRVSQSANAVVVVAVADVASLRTVRLQRRAKAPPRVTQASFPHLRT